MEVIAIATIFVIWVIIEIIKALEIDDEMWLLQKWKISLSISP